jgi:hypothetical protein
MVLSGCRICDNLTEGGTADALELKNNNQSAKAKRILVGADVHLRGYQVARKVDNGPIGARLRPSRERHSGLYPFAIACA